MPDVEFLTPDEPDVGGEVLDTGPRRPIPRWAVVLGVLVVVAAIVVAVVAHGSDSQPTATPSTGVTSSTPTPVSVTPNLAVQNSYSLVGDPVEHRLFALSDSRLFAIRTDGRPFGQGVPIQVGSLTDSEVELVLDAPHHLLWAVPQNATGHDGLAAGFAEPFDTRNLHSYGRIPLPGRVEGAAVLDGTLYVTTDLGLWRSTLADGPFERVRTAASAASAQLISDPSRHRIIVVRNGATTSAFVYPSASGARPRALPGLTVTLAVVGRTIWRAGSLRGHGVLITLDPTTLRARRDVAPEVDDVEIHGTGERSLYVTLGSDLVCLSGSSGQFLHNFGDVRGDFASVGGRGFLGTAERLAPVPMGRCPG